MIGERATNDEGKTDAPCGFALLGCFAEQSAAGICLW
jgi:hypothetical protein